MIYRKPHTDNTLARTNLSSGAQGDNSSYNYSADMDKDWYYRWLLLSNLQNPDWQQKLLSSQAPTNLPAMTLVNSGCICGICEASGQGVHQTPGTFPRLLQALDLNKLPPLLTEEQLRQRIGLCNRCENKIKVLEDACNMRDNLKESFISHLKHLSG